MDVANLNPMVAPNSGGNLIPKNLNSGSGSTIIYIVVVLVILILLVAVGYFAMKSSKQEETGTGTGVIVSGKGVVYTEKDVAEQKILDAREQAYIAYQLERGNPVELEEDGSLASSDTTTDGDTPSETIRISDEGSMIENYIVMPDNIDYEYQTYAYNPKDTDINGSAITFDKETNKCPDGTLDCLYYTRVEDGRVTSISDKDGVELIEKFTEDLWNGRLELLETPDSVEMMKAYELNEKKQLMRDGKVVKPGVDLTVGQYLIIFSIMYRLGAAASPKIIYDFSPKITDIQITEKLPSISIPPPTNEPIILASKFATDNVTEDVSSVEREMVDLGSEVEQKPQTETPPVQTTLNDISAKITFVSPSPSIEQETPTLDSVQTQVELVTPVVSTTPTPTLGNIRERVKL
jgi:hypothetical protein